MPLKYHGLIMIVLIQTVISYSLLHAFIFQSNIVTNSENTHQFPITAIGAPSSYNELSFKTLNFKSNKIVSHQITVVHFNTCFNDLVK